MKKLLDVAAEELDADVKDLEAKNKEIFVKRSPERKISYADAVAASIAKRNGDTVIGEGHFRTVKDVPTHPSLATTKGRWSENYAADAQIAEVEVDTETGMVKIVKATMAHDCGFPSTPAGGRQIDGQISMAQGHALCEEVLVKDGHIINPSFLAYKIPCALDMVENEQIHVITEKYEKGRSYDTKEVGEGHVSGILAAIANAVYDATGVWVKELPFIRTRSWRVSKERIALEQLTRALPAQSIREAGLAWCAQLAFNKAQTVHTTRTGTLPSPKSGCKGSVMFASGMLSSRPA